MLGHLRQLQGGGDLSGLCHRCRGQPLDGANRYTLRFVAGQLPPVNAFWSLTMYELPAEPARGQSAQSLPAQLADAAAVAEADADGGLTLYVQNESPGKDKEPNWLPAPEGPFFMAMRLYWPKAAALDGSWKKPPHGESKLARCR